MSWIFALLGFVDDHHTLTVDVPTTGTWTPYRLLGDAFGYLAVAGLLLLLAAAAIRMLRMRTRRT